jgi:hypothetical protein
MNDSIESQLKASTLFESRIGNGRRSNLPEKYSERKTDKLDGKPEDNAQKRRPKKGS